MTNMNEKINEIVEEEVIEEVKETDEEVTVPTTDMEFPEDIQENQDDVKGNPLFWVIGGGIMAGIAIAAGAKVLKTKIQEKRAARAEAEETEDLSEDSEEAEGSETEVEEIDIHPEIASERAKDLLKGKSQRKNKSKKKNKKK